MTGGLMSYGVDYTDLVSPRGHLRRQDFERGQARRSAGRAANEVRVRDQSESSETDRPDDSTRMCSRGRTK